MGKYDFDKLVNRRGTDSYKWDVGEDELPMWVADMDFQTAPAIRESLAGRVAHGIFGYADVTDEWYKAYISWWSKRHGFDMKKEWLIFTTGVVPAISCLVRKLTTPAEKVVIQTPVYNIFFNSIVNNGRVPLESPLIVDEDGIRMDFEQLEADLSDPQTTLMILCNPQNPGGRIWDADTLRKVADLCDKYGVRVISDEVHCDIVAPGKRYVPFASVSDTAAKISVTCMSPSKAFNVAGIHSAAVCVPNEILRNKVWRGLNTDEVAEPNSFATTVAIAAYTKSSQWLDELNSYIFDNKEYVECYVKDNIPSVKVIKGDATYLMWMDVRSICSDSVRLCEYIRQTTGLYISNGRQFGKAGEGFVRINVACPREIVKLGMEKFKEAVILFNGTKGKC